MVSLRQAIHSSSARRRTRHNSDFLDCTFLRALMLNHNRLRSLRCGRYHAPVGLGLECLVTLCLSHPTAKESFCGSIDDGGDQADYEMARRYLVERFGPLQLGAELAFARQCPAACDYSLGAKAHCPDCLRLAAARDVEWRANIAEVMDDTDPGLITAAEFNCWSGRAGRGR
jgi:hypothetical protein